MRLIGRERLNGFSGGDPTVIRWVVSWVAELQAAHWRKPSDVLKQFPSAKQRENGTFVFVCMAANVGICVCFAFPRGIALICGLENND